MADAMWTLRVDPHFDEETAKEFALYLRHNLGPRIQANARRTVPVLSGDLKRSIVIQVKEDGADSVLQVGVDQDVAGVDYATFVELGTSRAPAQPYMRPAILQARGVTAA